MIRKVVLALAILGALMMPSVTLAKHGGGHGGGHHGGGGGSKHHGGHGGGLMVAVANITAGMVEDIMVANIMADGMGMGTMVVGITVIGTLAMAATGTVAGMTME